MEAKKSLLTLFKNIQIRMAKYSLNMIIYSIQLNNFT